MRIPEGGIKGKFLDVLLIEDNPGDVELIKESLAADRHRLINVQVCETLTAASEVLEENRFDLILLDLNLSDSNGLQTLHRLRSIRSSVPVVVLIGQDDMQLAHHCIHAGAMDYLVKGKVDSIIGSAIYNATARAAEQKFADDSYENLRNMLDDSRDALVVLATENRVQFANKAAQSLFGKRVQPGEEIGMLAISPGQVQELEVLRPDGALVYVELSVSDTSWYGAPAKIATFRDVTERRMALDALRSSKEKYRLLVESSRDGIFISRKGQFIFANQAFLRLLGYTKSEILAMTHAEICTGKSSAVLQDRTMKRNNGESVPEQYELEYKTSAGSVIPVEVSEQVIALGNQSTIFTIVRDISRLKKIKNILETQKGQQESTDQDFITICANCYQIRDGKEEDDPWIRPDHYLTLQYPQLQFSHGICPKCIVELYPDYEE